MLMIKSYCMTNFMKNRAICIDLIPTKIHWSFILKLLKNNSISANCWPWTTVLIMKTMIITIRKTLKLNKGNSNIWLFYIFCFFKTKIYPCTLPSFKSLMNFYNYIFITLYIFLPLLLTHKEIFYCFSIWPYFRMILFIIEVLYFICQTHWTSLNEWTYFCILTCILWILLIIVNYTRSLLRSRKSIRKIFGVNKF